MTTVHVEVDLYSGRQNPGWQLADAEAAHFRTQLRELSSGSAGVSAVPDGLGYRGLRVTMNSDGVIERFLIATGMVIIEATTAGDRRSLRDPDRALEKWLLRTGREHLEAEQLRYVLGE